MLSVKLLARESVSDPTAIIVDDNHCVAVSECDLPYRAKRPLMQGCVSQRVSRGGDIVGQSFLAFTLAVHVVAMRLVCVDCMACVCRFYSLDLLKLCLMWYLRPLCSCPQR